jgi:hypothetical protein
VTKKQDAEYQQIQQLGAYKRAAKRINVPFDVYMEQIEKGNLWCASHRKFEPAETFEINMYGKTKPYCKAAKTSLKITKNTVVQSKEKEVENLCDALNIPCIANDPEDVNRIERRIEELRVELQELEKGA